MQRWKLPAISAALILASWVGSAAGHHTLGDVLMVAAALVAGWRVALSAWRALVARDIGIDALVTVAATGAILIGNYWEAAAVTFLFSVGSALEAATLDKTRSALTELIAIAPDIALLERDGQVVEVAAGEVPPGEIIIVKTGARVPVDGVVASGRGTIDQSTITGESVPVEKTVGENVYAGTISRSGFLRITATGVGADTTLARIIHRVEEAQEAKAPTQTFLEQFSRWYTPAIIVLAVVSGLVLRDLELALTLLVIGCPGALVISIPVAIVSGIGRAARDGVLIKGGEYLETAAKVDAVALDKTGTLTAGTPVLTTITPLSPHTETEVLAWAGRAEAGSEHPLAAPIVHAAKERGLDTSLAEKVESVPGKGICASVDGHEVLAGNAALFAEHGIDAGRAATIADSLAGAGHTPMLIAVDGEAIGVLAVADEIRPSAPAMITELREKGISRIVMLTGDAQPVARAVAHQAGIEEVAAQLLPEDKLDEIERLRQAGHTVAMIGDGVNDAPALASADLGVAMGAAGSAVATETADLALMSDDLMRLPHAIGLARRTLTVMRQNIALALLTVALLMTGVFAGEVTMALGMLVHEASVLLVIANAMRLPTWPEVPASQPR